MSFTDRYRAQHADLASLAQQLARMVDGLKSDADCDQVRAELNKLAGKLSVHLAMEDDALYPRLKQHEDAELRQAAERFDREMGGVAGAFKAYNQRWDGRAIKADVQSFAADTKKVMTVLMNRIQQENTGLYALADAKLA